jgi:hypothetical protein
MTQDYHCSIVIAASARTVFESINRISSWWTENFYGSTQSAGDRWTVSYGRTFVNAEVVERVPDRTIVWMITDCHLHWLKNKTEWKNTRLRWQLTETAGSTEINFTHVGLVPQIECYEDCRKGWDQYIKGSLPQLITRGKGKPEKKLLLV